MGMVYYYCGAIYINCFILFFPKRMEKRGKECSALWSAGPYASSVTLFFYPPIHIFHGDSISLK